jgi:uncharacterized integral membrane protein (TIGR00697 family)
LTNLLVWILLITAITFLGAWYARRYNRPDALIALYVTFVILSQIIASKIAQFDLGFWTVTAPAAAIIYPVTYLFTDIMNEKFGRVVTHRMIAIAFVANLAMVFFMWIATRLSPAPFWYNQTGWNAIFGLVPRITLASMVSFLVSENLDALIYSWFRKLTKGKYLWMRSAFSGIPALTIDTFIFVTIAFYGTMPLGVLFQGQIATKYLVFLSYILIAGLCTDFRRELQFPKLLRIKNRSNV